MSTRVVKQMSTTAWKARFPEVYRRWRLGEITQCHAAIHLEISERTFRRYVVRYRAHGVGGLEDRRASRLSRSAAPVSEIVALNNLYKGQCDGWNVSQFYQYYRSEHKGIRSYNWVRNHLQAQGTVAKLTRSRDCIPKAQLPRTKRIMAQAGALIHLVSIEYEWINRERWVLVATLDDATNRLHSAVFSPQPEVWSTFQGIRQVVATDGLFDRLYVSPRVLDWHQDRQDQLLRALCDLGIEVITCAKPQWAGRIGRLCRTLMDRVPKELALHGTTGIAEGNRILHRVLPMLNKVCGATKWQPGSRFVPLSAGMVRQLSDVFCLRSVVNVRPNNRVLYEGRVLSIPIHRGAYLRAPTVGVHEYEDGTLAIFEGREHLASYDCFGQFVSKSP